MPNNFQKLNIEPTITIPSQSLNFFAIIVFKIYLFQLKMKI